MYSPNFVVVMCSSLAGGLHLSVMVPLDYELYSTISCLYMLKSGCFASREDDNRLPYYKYCFVDQVHWDKLRHFIKTYIVTFRQDINL